MAYLLKRNYNRPQTRALPSRVKHLRLRPRIRKWRRAWRYWFLQLRRSREKPQRIARGLAAGVFAGFLPFFGFQTIVGAVLAVLLRGNKIAAVLGTWISNPLTYLPLFWWNLQVGCWLLGSSVVLHPDSFNSMQAFLRLQRDFISCMLLGSVLMGFFGALAAYFLALWPISIIRRAARR